MIKDEQIKEYKIELTFNKTSNVHNIMNLEDTNSISKYNILDS